MLGTNGGGSFFLLPRNPSSGLLCAEVFKIHVSQTTK